MLMLHVKSKFCMDTHRKRLNHFPINNVILNSIEILLHIGIDTIAVVVIVLLSGKLALCHHDSAKDLSSLVNVASERSQK